MTCLLGEEMMDDQTVELLKIQMRIAWEGLKTSLVDLTDEEFYWQPVPNCWTVHQDDQGKWISDYAEPEPDPPPFTTIGWRLVHIAACKRMYLEYAFGPGILTWDELAIPHTAEMAMTWLKEGYQNLKNALDELRDDGLSTLRKTNWGDEWPTWRIFWAMTYHDLHHGAEISCLRDLYEAMKGE
ncbi:MAG: DinB family protein [Anaerolineales bacterium]